MAIYPHCCLSSISCLTLSQHYMWHQLPCDVTSYMTQANLGNHLCSTLTLIGPITCCTISPVSHVEWTDGLLSRPHCNLSISSQVPHHFPFYDLCHILVFHTVLDDGSGKGSNPPCCRQTSRRTHHATQLHKVFPHDTIMHIYCSPFVLILPVHTTEKQREL